MCYLDNIRKMFDVIDAVEPCDWQYLGDNTKGVISDTR